MSAFEPKAGQWAVVKGVYGYHHVRVDAVTPKLIKERRSYGNRFTQYPRDGIAALFDNEASARQLSQAIDGVRGGLRNRYAKENQRHKAAMQAIADKQAALTRDLIEKAIAKQGGAA